MKKTVKTTILMALMLSAQTMAMATTDSLTVRIKAMRCDDCAHKVKTAIEQEQGILDILFNLERRTATVFYDTDKTSADSIEARIAATRRYKPSAYSKDDIILRGMGLRMDDMHCQKCANRITQRLEQMEGIDSLAPHLDKQYVFIRYDANKTCKDSIRQALSGLGFTPVNYYTSDKVDYAYYKIPEKAAANKDIIDKVLCIEAVDDVNVNPKRQSLAVTYFCKEITDEQLLKAIRKAGIKATLPPLHVCKENAAAKK